MADYSEVLDEGMRKIGFYLKQELSKHHTVKPLSLNNALSRQFLNEVKSFQPDIIHYIPGPSIMSFVLMKTLKISTHAKTVISATHPAFYGVQGLRYSPYYALSSLFQPFIPLLKPDKLLVQDSGAEKMFKKLGCSTEFLPSGVDVERFTPVSPGIKAELRKKYSVSQDKFVILHCGSFRRWRNIQPLVRLQKEGNQVIVVGNSTAVEEGVYRELEQSGCLTWKQYIRDIEEVYQLADCYVFPTIDRRGSIDFPVSVLEAMACNLPVVSTGFGALPRVFTAGDGFFFADNIDQIIEQTDTLKASKGQVKTREKALPFRWQSIAIRLEEIYRTLASSS